MKYVDPAPTEKEQNPSTKGKQAVIKSELVESFQNIEERSVDYVDVSDEEMSVGKSVEAEDELNISRTSSEADEKADDTNISLNKDTE